MEFRLPPGRPPSSNDEEDQLAAVLDAERQLVIETQENYRFLKERFLENEEELVLARKELEILRAEKEAERKSREELGRIEEKSRVLLRQMEEDQKQRQLSQHQFQTNTLAELQKVFRKELADQEGEIKRLEEEKEGLVEENDRLLEENRQLQMDIGKRKKTQREREREMAKDFDRQIQEVMALEKKKIGGGEENETVRALRERVRRMEETARIREAEERRRREDAEEKTKAIVEQLAEERQKNQRLTTYQAQVEQTQIEARKSVHEKHKELDEMRKKLTQLRTEKLKAEAEASERERRIMNDFCEQSFSIDEKLTTFETVIKERDNQIEELIQKLERSRLEETEVQQLELNSQTERESRERVEKENKRLTDLVERKEAEQTHQMSLLKMERNRLEETVAELRRRLATSPETVEEVSRLRLLLSKKEEEEKALKQHYRGLLSRMKKSLKNIEKKHRHTQKKLDDHILL